MGVNVNCAVYSRYYAAAKCFALAAFACCFFYGSTVGRDSIPGKSTDANGDGAARRITKPLAVGDEVPDVELNMMNYPKSVAKLSDFRGKIVILDFWATWCSGCITTMPQEDTLQKKFSDSIQFLLVNSIDKFSVLESFMKNRKGRALYNISLPIVAQDSILRTYFPFHSIPHYVLIDPNGKVAAITSANQINADNIEKMIKGKPVKIYEKNDARADDFTRAYLNDSTTKGILLIDSTAGYVDFSNKSFERGAYLIFSKETYIDGVVQSIHQVGDGLFDGLRFCNMSLENLMFLAYPEMNKIPRDRWIIDRSVNELWRHEKLFCVELVAPEGIPLGVANAWLQLDMFKALGVSGQVVEKDTVCLVVGRIDKSLQENGMVQKVERGYKELTLQEYISTFQDSCSVPIIVKDREDLSTPIVVPRQNGRSIENIKTVLIENGYAIKTEKMPVSFFFITRHKK